MRLLKRILLLLVIVLASFLVYHHRVVGYGLQQAYGQAKILWNVEDINLLLNDPQLPDSVKQKFNLIKEIKSFAEDSLGLVATENYSTYYNQKGKPILWTVTASPEFKIEAYQWKFPVAGNFPYKGFFDLNKAEAEELKLKKLGFDTEINEVSAWSTLGWFKDPILSSMLSRSAGRLADLIIHETTHATIYLKDSVQYNENLASFIGRRGADAFLAHQFGKNSRERIDYQNDLKRRKVFRNYMQSALVSMAEKYNSMDNTLAISEKRKLKAQWIEDLKVGLLQTEYYKNDSTAAKRLQDWNPNNAYFSGFSTYSDEIPLLELKLNREFNGNLKAMIFSFKTNGLSL